MEYLICDNFEGYYELKKGESLEDFTEECKCGGELRYAENIPVVGEEKQKSIMIPISDYGKTNDSHENVSHQEEVKVYNEKSPILALNLSFLITGLGNKCIMDKLKKGLSFLLLR